MRSIIKSVGGKYYLAPFLQRHMPLGYKTRCENFARGYNLTLSLPHDGRTEIWNDLDPELFHLFKTVTSYLDPFLENIKVLPYSQGCFELCKRINKPEPLQTYVRINMSRGGMSQTFSWSNRFRGGDYGDVNAWKTRIEELPKISHRLRDVIYRCQCGILLLQEQSSDSKIFQYIDPPYLSETRTATKVYGDYEMPLKAEGQKKGHLDLLDAAKQCKGPVMISGYVNPIYDSALKSWNRVDVDMPNHSGQGRSKQRRIESIWKNY